MEFALNTEVRKRLPPAAAVEALSRPNFKRHLCLSTLGCHPHYTEVFET